MKEIFPSRTTINNDRFDALMRYFEREKTVRNHPGFSPFYTIMTSIDSLWTIPTATRSLWSITTGGIPSRRDP